MKLVRKYYFSSLGLRTFSRFSATLQIRNQNELDKSTIDYQDITKYSKHTANWWDLNGGFKLLHIMNPLRIKFIRDGLATTGFKETNPQQPLEGLKLLDVGCGGGVLSESLAKMGAQVTGIDISKELLAIAEEHAAAGNLNRSNLEYKNVAIEDLSQEKIEHYDVVVASEIIEHVDNQHLFLKRCAEVLKPNGSIFVTTLNKNLISWLWAIVVLEYIFRHIPLGLHDWHKFITPQETKQFLEMCDCETKLVQGSFYNPVTSKWLMTPSTAVFYALHAVKQENK